MTAGDMATAEALAEIALGVLGLIVTIAIAAIGHIHIRINAQAVLLQQMAGSVSQTDLSKAIADVEHTQEQRNDRLWTAIGTMATKADLHREVDRLQETMRELLRPGKHDTGD